MSAPWGHGRDGSGVEDGLRSSLIQSLWRFGVVGADRRAGFCVRQPARTGCALSVNRQPPSTWMPTMTTFDAAKPRRRCRRNRQWIRSAARKHRRKRTPPRTRMVARTSQHRSDRHRQKRSSAPKPRWPTTISPRTEGARSLYLSVLQTDANTSRRNKGLREVSERLIGRGRQALAKNASRTPRG